MIIAYLKLFSTGNTKLKLSLALKRIPNHADVWRSGGIVPRIPNSTLKGDELQPRPCYIREKNPGIHWTGGWTGLRTDVEKLVRQFQAGAVTHRLSEVRTCTNTALIRPFPLCKNKESKRNLFTAELFH